MHHRNKGAGIMTHNQQIKKLLKQVFNCKISVHYRRSGWLGIVIDYAPRHREEARQLHHKVSQLVAQITDVGTYGYDGGSDYGYGKRLMINFLPVQDDDPMAHYKDRDLDRDLADYVENTRLGIE